MGTRRSIVVAAATAALVAGGCGLRSEVAGRATVEVVANAGFLAASAERTVGAGTGRFELTMDVTVPAEAGLSGPLLITGEGAFDSDAGRASLRMDLSAMADALRAAGEGGEVGGGLEQPGASGFGEVFGEAFDEPMEVVVDGEDVYVRMPLLAMLGAGEGEWVTADAGLTGGPALGLPGSTATGAVDPTALLEFLRGAAGGVQTIGTEDVRGVSTTRLRAELTVDDILRRSTPEQRDRVQAAIDGMDLEAAGLDRFPMDVWVDGQGLVRRLQTSYGGAAADGGTVTLTVEWFDFGTEVDIRVPAPEDVVDLPSHVVDGAGEPSD